MEATFKESEANLNSGKKKGSGLRRFCGIIGTILFILIVVLELALYLPRLFGFEMFHIVSGSMEPAISTGSLVLVKQIPESELPTGLEEGDIAAFWGRSSVITHRVVENRAETKEIVTKGDANPQEDMAPAAYADVIGKVQLSIPGLGALLALMTSGTGKIITFAWIAVALVLFMIGSGGEK